MTHAGGGHEAAYLVALTRWSSAHGLDEELPGLAAAMGLSPYDARLRLAPPPPLVLATGLPTPDAQAWLTQLRGRGHGAVACMQDGLPVSSRISVPRQFALRGPELVVLDERRLTLSIPFDEILGLVRAAEISEAESTLRVKERKLAIGRAVMSGGLMRHKNVEKIQTTSATEREEVLYLFRRSVTEPMLFKEHSLSYEGLGAERKATAHQSFDTLVTWLRAAAPSGFYDDRLLSQKRRADLTAVRGTSAERVVSSSNAAANHLAAYLLMHAYVQGQL